MTKFGFIGAFCLFLATGIGGFTQAKTVNIVTDIAPVQAIVLGLILPETVSIQLVPTAISSHDFALKPSQISAMQQADLIVWLGPVATPGLARLMAQPEMVAKSITLNNLAQTRRLRQLKPGLFNPATVTGSLDPHTWLDPENARYWSARIAQALARLDPENRENYRALARRQSDLITQSVDRIRASFSASSLLPFVQFHEAFQYFEKRFSLQPIGAATTQDARATSLGATSTLRHALENQPRSCVLVRDSRQAEQARPFSEISGVRTGFVDPLGADIQGVDYSYTTLLDKVAAGFKSCLTATP